MTDPGFCAVANDTITFACNPVSNEGCTATQACDVFGSMDFSCYDNNTAGAGEACNQQNGPYCKTNLTCFKPDPNAADGTGTLASCARYCCTDAQCAAAGGGTCTKTLNGGAWFKQSPDIGVCQ